jgi:hypothetical protein
MFEENELQYADGNSSGGGLLLGLVGGLEVFPPSCRGLISEESEEDKHAEIPQTLE